MTHDPNNNIPVRVPVAETNAMFAAMREKEPTETQLLPTTLATESVVSPDKKVIRPDEILLPENDPSMIMKSDDDRKAKLERFRAFARARERAIAEKQKLFKAEKRLNV